MSLALEIFSGLFLYVLFVLLSDWWRDAKQYECDNKVDYDPMYDMWFSEMSTHDCRLCRNDKRF